MSAVPAVPVEGGVIRAELMIYGPNPIAEVTVVTIEPGIRDGEHFPTSVQSVTRAEEGRIDAAYSTRVIIVDGDLRGGADMENPAVHGEDGNPGGIDRARLAQVGVTDASRSDLS